VPDLVWKTLPTPPADGGPKGRSSFFFFSEGAPPHLRSSTEESPLKRPVVEPRFPRPMSATSLLRHSQYGPPPEEEAQQGLGLFPYTVAASPPPGRVRLSRVIVGHDPGPLCLLGGVLGYRLFFLLLRFSGPGPSFPVRSRRRCFFSSLHPQPVECNTFDSTTAAVRPGDSALAASLRPLLSLVRPLRHSFPMSPTLGRKRYFFPDRSPEPPYFTPPPSVCSRGCAPSGLALFSLFGWAGVSRPLPWFFFFFPGTHGREVFTDVPRFSVWRPKRGFFSGTPDPFLRQLFSMEERTLFRPCSIEAPPTNNFLRRNPRGTYQSQTKWSPG